MCAVREARKESTDNEIAQEQDEIRQQQRAILERARDREQGH